MLILRTMVFVLLAYTCSTAQAKVVGSEVDYTVDGTNFKGYLAYDDAQNSTRPGIIVVHEWWGHNDYARKRANMLAESGYVSLALDMYGEGKQADHPADAGKFSKAVSSNLDLAEKRFMAAYQLLQQQAHTDKSKIGAIGYCFGGGIALAMARLGVELDGVVSFHGSPNIAAPVGKGRIKGSLLVLNGAADPFVKPEQIDAFKQEMIDAGVDFKVVNYPDAKHAFTNPEADALGAKFSIPLAYNKTADEQSWKEMQAFFSRIFK